MNKNQILSILIALVIIVVSVLFSDKGIRGLLEKPINNKKSTTINNIKPGVEESTVMRVVDGDTLELQDGRKIRMLNVDTPETVKENTPVMCYGYEASEFTKKTLSNKLVWLTSDKEKTDKYGRHLRVVYLAGQDTDKVENSFNYQLAINGYGRVNKYKPNTTNEPILREGENIAKKNRIGIWGACQKPFIE